MCSIFQTFFLRLVKKEKEYSLANWGYIYSAGESLNKNTKNRKYAFLYFFAKLFEVSKEQLLYKLLPSHMWKNPCKKKGSENWQYTYVDIYIC